jgi:hypothetical protein
MTILQVATCLETPRCFISSPLTDIKEALSCAAGSFIATRFAEVRPDVCTFHRLPANRDPFFHMAADKLYFATTEPINITISCMYTNLSVTDNTNTLTINGRGALSLHPGCRINTNSRVRLIFLPPPVQIGAIQTSVDYTNAIKVLRAAEYQSDSIFEDTLPLLNPERLIPYIDNSEILDLRIVANRTTWVNKAITSDLVHHLLNFGSFMNLISWAAVIVCTIAILYTIHYCYSRRYKPRRAKNT